MKPYMKYIQYAVIACFMFTSCNSLLEVDPEEVLPTEDYLGYDRTEARAALFGVLALMQDVPEQYVLAGEARGDLATVSPNSVDDVQELNNHSISEDNIYASSEVLFSIINNCNYALELLDTAAYEDELLPNYASMMRIRTWAQFNVLINYGKLPYYEDPIVTDGDLSKEYAVLGMDAALDTLINNLLEVSGIEDVYYEASEGLYPSFMIPNHDLLLADLYLWAKDYVMAATQYKYYLDLRVYDAGNDFNLTSSYGISYSGTTSTISWLNIFGESYISYECAQYIGYSELYRQTNTAYTYIPDQLAASSYMMQDWAIQSRVDEDGNDLGLGDARSFVAVSSLLGYNAVNKLSENFFTWQRAAHVYLKMAEAINYAGYPEHALAIVNSGVYSNSADSTSIQFTGNDVSFLNFDQDKYVEVNSSGLQTGGNLGIRGRVGLAPLPLDSGMAVSLVDSMIIVGDYILAESGRETSFEGNRYADLVRTARHQNDPTVVGNAIYNKFVAEGDLSKAVELQALLSDEINWYLPLTLPANFIEQ